MTGPNALHPMAMTAAERLEEVASILALGLVRLRARQSSRLSAGPAKSSLHCGGDASVGGTRRMGGTT